jgi:hypothetical protein
VGKSKKKAIRPRDARVLTVGGSCTATSWYYRCDASDEVVVQVMDHNGAFVTTVVVRIPHQRKKVRRG